MQEEPSSKSLGISQQELDQFVQTHTLAQIYQKFLRSCPSQTERIQHIKDFLNLKSSQTQPFILMSQMDELTKQEGTQFSKNEIVSHLEICQTILQYQKNLQNNQNQQNQLSNQNEKDSECLLITIYLNTFRMVYFQSDKSWMQSQHRQMKFQFRCLLFDLLNQVIISISSLAEEQNEIKLIELIQLLRGNNLIDNLLTWNMHLQILKKAHHIFSFSLQFNIISQQKFFGLIRNYLKKSVQQKRASQEILKNSIQYMDIQSLVKSLDFIQNQILNLQPKLIEDSSVSCIEGLIEKISKNKEGFLANKQNEIKVYDLVSKVKQMSEKIQDRHEIRSKLNKVYYEAVDEILRSAQIKRKMVINYNESMVRIAKYLQHFCLNEQRLNKQMDMRWIQKQIEQVVDNFIKLIGSFEYLSQDQREKQKEYSIIGVCKYLLDECLINELIIHCLNSIQTYKNSNKKISIKKSKRQQQIFNTSIRKLLQLQKYILISTQSGEDRIKQEIQKVFNIIEGSMQFLHWVMQFDNLLQNQIFASIFTNLSFGYSFKEITPLGFNQLYKKFLQLNYEKNKLLIVYFNQKQGIRFMMKKSMSFKQNLLLENAVIQVSQQDLIEEDKILQVVPIEVVMKQWQGVGFMVMLSWYSQYEQIKRRIIQLLRYSRYFQKSTIEVTRHSHEAFIKLSIDYINQTVKQLQREDNNQQQKNKNVQLVKGILSSLALFIKQIKEESQQQYRLSMGSLQTINMVEVSIKVIDDIKDINVQKIYQKIKQNTQNQRLSSYQQYFKDILLNNSQQIKVSANNQSHLSDIINICLKLRNKLRQQKISIDPNDYLCFITNKSNKQSITNKSNKQSILNKPSMSRWSKLNQIQMQDKGLVLINKYLYRLVTYQKNIQQNVDQNTNKNNKNNTLNNKNNIINISYQTVELLLRLIQQISIENRQLLQQIRCYWTCLQHYQLIKQHLQQLIQTIVNKQTNKYKLVLLIYSNLLSKDKSCIYRTFIINLFQIIQTLFQVTLTDKNRYPNNRSIIRQILQTKQNYQLFFRLTQLQPLMKHKQCIYQINNVINLIPVYKQWYTQTIEDIMRRVVESRSYKQKSCLLRITLHKLVNSLSLDQKNMDINSLSLLQLEQNKISQSLDQMIKWRANKYIEIVVKQLEQIVLKYDRQSQCNNKEQIQQLQTVLIQHIIIDLSYSLKTQSKQLMQRVFNNIKLSLNSNKQKQKLLNEINNSSNVNLNQQGQSYTKWVVKDVLPVKSLLAIIDKLIDDSYRDNIQLTKYSVVLLYQYLYLSVGECYYHQLLIYILQKLTLTNKLYPQVNRKIQQIMMLKRENTQIEGDNTKRQTNNKIYDISSQMFMCMIKSVQVISEQTLILLIMYVVNKIGQTIYHRQQSVNRDQQHTQQLIKVLKCSQLQLQLLQQYTNRFSYTQYNRSQQPSIQQNHQLSYQLSMRQDRVKFVQEVTILLNKQLQSLYSSQTINLINSSQTINQIISQSPFILVLSNTLRSISLVVKAFPIIQILSNINWKELTQRLLPYKQYQQQKELNIFLSTQVRIQTVNLIIAISSIQPTIRNQLIHIYIVYFIKYLQETNIVISKDSQQLKQNRVGLHNYGNTCYINSLIQLLFNITPLSQTLINYYQSSPNSYTSLTLTIKQLKQLFTILKHSNAKHYSPFQFVSSLQSHLNLADQQDTTQFFHIIHNQLQKSHLNHLLQHIQGTTLTTVICQNCHQSNTKKQPFLLYNLQIQNHTQLLSAINDMGKQQLISDYKCHQCYKSTTVKKYTQIHTIPQYFFIQLKRINYDYNLLKLVKIHNRFQFPQILDLTHIKNNGFNNNNMSLRQEQENLLQLFGIIVHKGNGQQGHYFSYVKQQNERWTCYNDTVVTSHHKDQFIEKCYGNNNKDTNCSENAYILVYRKLNKREQIKQRYIKIQNKSSLSVQQNIQSDLITKIREQNDKRLMINLLSQYDPTTNKNLITNFIDQLLQTYQQPQLLQTRLYKQTCLQLYLQFSFNFIHIKLPYSQFFFNKTKSLLQKYSSKLIQRHLLKYFPQDLIYFQTSLLMNHTSLLVNQNSIENIFDSFSYDVFVTIFSALIINSYKIGHQKQITSILSPLLEKYLTNILELTPKYLNSINENKQTHTRLYNLIKLFNHIINITDNKHKKYLFRMMFTKISFTQLLKKFVQIKFSQYKIYQQILKFISNILKVLSKNNNNSQLNSIQITINEKQVFDNVDRCRDVLVSNQFWLKITTIIQNLTTQFIQKQSYFLVIQPVFHYSLSNSFQLRSKLQRYIDHKIQAMFINLREGNFMIEELKKWLQVLKILLINQITDRICSNLQRFNLLQGELIMEQEWNSLIKVKVQNPNISKGLVQTLTRIQGQMIQVGVELLQTGQQNEKMETQQQVLMRKQRNQQQEQLMKKRRNFINLFTGNKMKVYLQCLQSCLSLIMGLGQQLIMNRINIQSHQNRYLYQMGQLQQHIVQICEQSINKIIHEVQDQPQVTNKHSLIHFVNYLNKCLQQMQSQVIQSINSISNQQQSFLFGRQTLLSKVKQTKQINQRIRVLLEQKVTLFNQHRVKQTINNFNYIRTLNNHIKRKKQNILDRQLQQQINICRGDSSSQGIDICIRLIKVYQVNQQQIRQNINKMMEYQQHYTMYEMILQIDLNEQLAYLIKHSQLLITLNYSIHTNNNQHLYYALSNKQQQQQRHISMQKYILLTIEHLAQSINNTNNKNKNTNININQSNYCQLKINYNNNNKHITIKCMINKILSNIYRLNQVTPTMTVLSQQLFQS